MMRLHTSVWLPLPREDVFAFFAAAENLQTLTPAWLKFTILTPLPIAMRRHAVIDYRIGLHGIPMRWRTEITEWEPPVMFVDSQIRGPYRRWVHTHRFIEADGGTRIEDSVDFDMLGGRWVLWFVARDLRRIFTYRQVALLRAFGLPPAKPPHITIAAD